MKHTKLMIILLCTFFSSVQSWGDPVKISAGEFQPQYGPGGSKLPVKVAAFFLDRTPVTREEFAHFIFKNPQWRKEKVGRIFADESYLKSWKSNHYPKGTAKFPVTEVSYFAASALCESRGGRLPRVLEWEYAARASNDREAEAILNAITQSTKISAIGTSLPNQYGLHDLHGMIWEWTQDYNSSFVTSDNRQDGEMMKNFFCGAASTGAADRLNYPAFIRYAMRGGLKPDFSIHNLGFRCAYDKI